MVYHQNVLIELLSSAIFNKPEMVEVKQKIDWTDLYRETLDHRIAPLIYKAAKYKIVGEKPSNELLELWHKKTILCGIKQAMLFEHMKSVFVEFNNCKIDFLPLKGLVLKDLYPCKELRTMSDVDILIHKEDIERITEILQKLGYQQSQISNIHISFNHKNQLPVEIHWTLTYEKLFKQTSIFNNSVWENAIDTLYYDIPIRILSNEDMLLHICIHMATHFIFSGFGLRQLCDLVLFVEKNRGIIQWEYFVNKTSELGINKFVYVLFDASKRLFHLEVPNEIVQCYIENDGVTETLINEIFKSGVFGGKDVNQIVKITAMQYHKKRRQIGKTSKKDFFMALLFPSVKMYTNKYNYARKYPYLTPIFWVHHFINGIFRKEILIKDKLLSIYKAPGEAQRKQELLDNLGLL